MPFSYEKNYESLEDIDREYHQAYGPKRFPKTDHDGKRLRDQSAIVREEYIKALDFRDQMACRNITLTIDLRNKYQIRNAINQLQAALDAIEKEEFKVPFDPSTYDLLPGEF